MKTKYFMIFIPVLITGIISGCEKSDKQQNISTISVVGTGTVLVQPDVVRMNITFSNVAETTKAAQEAVSTMVRQALSILKDAGIW